MDAPEGTTVGTEATQRRGAAEGRRGGPPGDDGGFGLVEMVVAFALLLVVLTATAALTTTLFGQAATAQEQVTASNLADQTLSTLADAPLTTLQADVNRTIDLTASGPVVVGGNRYELSQYLAWYGTGPAPSLCVTGNPPEVLQATVTVSWANGTQHLAETSVIDPPYGSAQSSDGWLSVQVQSAANPTLPPADVGAISVVITPQGGSALPAEQPDSQGCLYAPEPAGTYTVAVEGPASPVFVDNDSQTTPPPVTVSVTSGQATDVDVPFDEAAAVTFTAAPTGVPVATHLPVTVANSGMTAGSEVAVPYPATSDGPVDLFPFPSGYNVWYGDCPDEEPAAPSSVSVSAGQPATAQIGGLVQLTLAVSTPGAAVSATATVTDPSCPADTFGLGQHATAGGTATVAAAVIAEEYSVTVTDTSDGATASLSLSWQGSQWLDTANHQSYGPTQPIPVTVS
jgi:type II secretory pathway pseudopilin PulG